MGYTITLSYTVYPVPCTLYPGLYYYSGLYDIPWSPGSFTLWRALYPQPWPLTFEASYNTLVSTQPTSPTDQERVAHIAPLFLPCMCQLITSGPGLAVSLAPDLLPGQWRLF